MSASTRAQRLGAEMRRGKVAVAAFSSAEDVCYATGFEVPVPIDAGAAFAHGPTLAFAGENGETVLVVPDAYAARARELSRADRTVLVPVFGHLEPVDSRAELLAGIRVALKELGARDGATIALDETTLPAELRSFIVGLLPASATADARDIARSARMIKTKDEIELLRGAAAAADAGHEALLTVAVPGRNELDVMDDVLTAVNRAAGRPLPWVGELVTGPRTGVPNYPGGPIDRQLEEGDTVLMDLSVRYLGYWADCTNTFAVAREPTTEQLRYFRATRDAYEAAVAELRPGRRASDVHAAAGRVLRGYGLEQVSYTGHQIGACVNEVPRLVPYDHTPIQAGMVFAVEPGCYGGKEIGIGARMERVVLVTDDGAEALTCFRSGMEG